MAPFNGKMPGFMGLQLAIDRIIINQRNPQPTAPIKALTYLSQIGMNSGFFKPEHALVRLQTLAGGEGVVRSGGVAVESYRVPSPRRCHRRWLEQSTRRAL